VKKVPFDDTVNANNPDYSWSILGAQAGECYVLAPSTDNEARIK